MTKAKTLNIRGVDSELLRLVKVQAAIRGMTMRDFAIEALKSHTKHGDSIRRLKEKP